LAPPPPVYREDLGIGDLVAVMRGERWWAAHVVEAVGSDHWRIHYDGWGPAYDEVVDICRVRPIDYVPGSSIIPPAFEPKMKVKRAGLVPAMGILFVLLILDPGESSVRPRDGVAVWDGERGLWRHHRPGARNRSFLRPLYRRGTIGLCELGQRMVPGHRVDDRWPGQVLDPIRRLGQQSKRDRHPRPASPDPIKNDPKE
jgi:hypothetical protein